MLKTRLQDGLYLLHRPACAIMRVVVVDGDQFHSTSESRGQARPLLLPQQSGWRLSGPYVDEAAQFEARSTSQHLVPTHQIRMDMGTSPGAVFQMQRPEAES